MLIVSKPAPLPCQASPRQEGMALENRLAARFGEPYVFRPVNRLDKGTSGLMAVARHPHALLLLSRMLHGEGFMREYLAVTVGRPPRDEGAVDAPIAKAPGATVRRQVSPRTASSPGPATGCFPKKTAFRSCGSARDRTHAPDPRAHAVPRLPGMGRFPVWRGGSRASRPLRAARLADFARHPMTARPSPSKPAPPGIRGMGGARRPECP